MIILTKDIFIELLPRTDPEVWYAIVADSMPFYSIDTATRICAFLANCAHESNNFNTLEENLNYSAKRLREVWPKRFPTIEIANKYARNPRALANYVYANRMGNGNEASGDGWKYRGRGIIQLTGKKNYMSCSVDLFTDDTLVQQPDLLVDPVYAFHSACWFWKKNGLNELADGFNLEEITRVINGGLNGHKERVENFDRMFNILKNHEPFSEQDL